MKKVILIFNPSAGNGNGKKLKKLILEKHQKWLDLEHLSLKGELSPLQMTWIETTETVEEWTARLEQEIVGSETLIVCIGGDGTFSLVAKKIFELDRSKKIDLKKLEFAFIPGGRGNDFIRGINGFDCNEEDYFNWGKNRNWALTAVDLGVVNDTAFLNMASIGYGGKVVEKTSAKNGFFSKSKLVYQVEGAISFFKNIAILGSVHARENSVYHGAIYGAFVGNGPVNGSGLYWMPSAQCTDGKLDLIVFPTPSLPKMIRSIVAVKKKQDPAFTHTRYSGTEFTIQFDEPTALELDGDFTGYFKKMQFSLQSGYLKVWIL